MPDRLPPCRVAVLASGGGSNLQALMDACVNDAPARVVLVASNNPESGALARARAAGIATSLIPDPADGAAITRMLVDAAAELVVLAGYLKLVPADTVRAFAGRMLNIHPALLPAHGGPGMFGARVHRAVLESGATQSGATVHLVTPEYDQGPLVARRTCPVLPGDTVDTLARRDLEVEHRLLPDVVLEAARAGRVVRIEP